LQAKHKPRINSPTANLALVQQRRVILLQGILVYSPEKYVE
jgi:hypothetical protein